MTTEQRKKCDGCLFLTYDEVEQNRLRELGISVTHKCRKYHKRVYHNSAGTHHDPNIYACEECIKDSELKSRPEQKDCSNCGFGAKTHSVYPGSCPRFHKGENTHCTNWEVIK